jgi:hypothetical protein
MQDTTIKCDKNIHLSLVATSRNDNHGGSLTRRMQHFINGFVTQCNRHNLRAELILVEWNPPTDRVFLAEELRWPLSSGLCDIRIITVPPDIHQELEHADKLPLFQMIAKNVGIRRARGKFVLATNIDILFSDESIIYMRDHLRKGRLYRADRLDVPNDVLELNEFHDILDYCWKEYFRINASQYTATRKDKEWSRSELWLARIGPNYRNLILRLRALPKLVSTNKAKSRNLYLWLARIGPNYRALLSVLRTPSKVISTIVVELRNWFINKAQNNNLSYGKLLIYIQNTIKNFDHKFIYEFYNRMYTFISNFKKKLQFLFLQQLHTNACGDFTLLAYDDWMALKGYPEWPIFSWHLDSVFLYQSFNSNFKEIYLGYTSPVFHIEHAKGSGYTPEGADALFKRLREINLPFLTNSDFTRIVSEQEHQKVYRRTISYNGSNWGLHKYKLKSIYIN